tara:strand:+ start:8346 stop:8867 length:522 start_codon:yes stop_codon:yes gene_type:complete
MSLILLRHTRPEGADGICYGRTDLPLAAGFEADVARLLAELPAITRILSSPLSRCLRLARAIADARGHTVEIDDRLIEMDFGQWENRPWDDIPREQIDAWLMDFDHARPHGGESVTQLSSRARAGFDAAVAGPVPALAVTHAGVIKAAMAATGAPKGWHTSTGFAQWRRFEWG